MWLHLPLLIKVSCEPCTEELQMLYFHERYRKVTCLNCTSFCWMANVLIFKSGYTLSWWTGREKPIKFSISAYNKINCWIHKKAIYAFQQQDTCSIRYHQWMFQSWKSWLYSLQELKGQNNLNSSWVPAAMGHGHNLPALRVPENSRAGRLQELRLPTTGACFFLVQRELGIRLALRWQ